MAFSRLGPLVVLLSLLGLASVATATTSVAIALCASLNTASTSANSSMYQSDGLCYGFCKDEYAYAIVQNDNCWCSDYTPATSVQVEMSQCNLQCPGYPDDLCGGSGLFGYISGDQKPAGTKGGETPKPTTSTTPPATTPKTTATTENTVTRTVQNTVTVGPTSSPEQTSTTTSKSPATTKQSDTDTPTTAPTTTASPSTFVSTVTQGGSVVLQTVTVMPTETPSSDASSANMSTGQKSLSTGAAVGIAVGVLGAVVIAIAIGVFFWLRRKKRNQEESMLEHQNSFRGSSAGMMSTPRTEMASVWDGDGQSQGRRNSRLMPHDPRMDPYVTNIYGRFDNKSHESVNTLRDDHDYSRRVLRTTNPDPAG